ncbi:helix-turn-helix domain-containing protein [Flavobacterium sp. fv08]|uniref:AraC family transcriptional regulator n=1 Tax=Flavobacterium sp. fv08 TaxID=1761784 RepID=UPI0008BABF8E|nr:helix-turn-helix domain-containing protein [Flavobacterium sp. fv08]SEP06657.1 Helix-turn-helix domain-containing protein [Flavobacterium sp. fv08]
MEKAGEILQFTISRESNSYFLSLDPKHYLGKLTIVFPVVDHLVASIIFFNDHYPSLSLSDFLNRHTVENEQVYLVQMNKNEPYFNQFLLEHFITGEIVSECSNEESKLVSKLIRKLYQGKSKNLSSASRQLYIKIMLQYLVELLSRKAGFSRRAEVLVNKFLLLLKSDRIPNHQVRHYAEKLFVSRRYLTLSVQKVLGSTPKNIIDLRIIEEAKRLLNSKDTVYSISEELQFDSAASFTSFFKKNTGITPSAYRLQIK